VSDSGHSAPRSVDAETILAGHAHRPFPLPGRPWLGQQQWLDVLFAHWRVDPKQLRAHVPAPLTLEVADNEAWLGLVAFAIRGLRVRSLPGVPTATDFLELNVRTYVSCAGTPGVFFFSLDASSTLAVLGARTIFQLPYFEAEMSSDAQGGGTRYRSVRRAAPEVRFQGRYRPEGDVFHAAPGTLDHFLTERYCLFTVRAGRAARVDIHHPPWPLQHARAELQENGMARPLGIALDRPPELLHYASYQPVLTWGARDAE
jgi:hypothetical protein